eukprot:TRINITY_DN63479_c0_g1_i1.p1 TRINITY_DN63479_c0_g1~~TRINITY_DN63479_c0_g1_i1.p1  ORF type:complete len:417 (-),score=95.47 TRINITY_DN63479_c0_g1_i1:28-1197(-)
MWQPYPSSSFLPTVPLKLLTLQRQLQPVSVAFEGPCRATPALASKPRRPEVPRTAISAASAALVGVALPSRRRRGQRARARLAAAPGPGDATGEGGAASPSGGASVSEAKKPSAAESRVALEQAATAGSYQNLTADQRGVVSNFFFPDEEELDMDKSMPLEDHISELRDAVLRSGAFATVAVGVCLYYYKELTTALESPAQMSDMGVKFVQLAPGEFFFVSVKVAVAVGLLLSFPYALFEAANYFTPALTRSERNTVGPTVLSSAALFYGGAAFAYNVLSPAALGFFLGYSQDVIESQFSIDQYFEFILSMGFATGIAFQVPVLQVALGLLGVIDSEKLFSIWRYVVVGSAVVGAILTPSTDPVTQLLLSGALCALYFAGAGVLKALGR